MKSYCNWWFDKLYSRLFGFMAFKKYVIIILTFLEMIIITFF